MRQSTIRVSTDRDQVRAFIQFAARYASDFGLPELDWVTELSLPEFWSEVKKRYAVEHGEKIIRPLYYWNDDARQAAGAQDCDDATIEFTARLLYAGYDPSQILVIEAKEPGQDYYCHIFSGLRLDNGEVIWLDNLPGSRYNRFDYDPALVRITTAADYL